MRLPHRLSAVLLAVSTLSLPLALTACGTDAANDGKQVSARLYAQFLQADRILFGLCATPAERRKAHLPSTGRKASWDDWMFAAKVVIGFGLEYDDRDYRVGEGNEKHRVGALVKDVEDHLRRCRPELADELHVGLSGNAPTM